MTKKQLWAVVVYIIAIVLPTAAIAAHYGFDTTVNLTNSPEARQQFFSMSAAVVCGVVISLGGSRLLGSETENLFGFAIRVLRQLNQQNAAPGR